MHTHNQKSCDKVLKCNLPCKIFSNKLQIHSQNIHSLAGQLLELNKTLNFEIKSKTVQETYNSKQTVHKQQNLSVERLTSQYRDLHWKFTWTPHDVATKIVHFLWRFRANWNRFITVARCHVGITPWKTRFYRDDADAGIL